MYLQNLQILGENEENLQFKNEEKNYFPYETLIFINESFIMKFSIIQKMKNLL